MSLTLILNIAVGVFLANLVTTLAAATVHYFHARKIQKAGSDFHEALRSLMEAAPGAGVDVQVQDNSQIQTKAGNDGDEWDLPGGQYL